MSRYQPLPSKSRNNVASPVRLTKEVIMRFFTVSRHPGGLLYLLVAVSLLLGLVGPAQVLASPAVRVQNAPQATTITLDGAVSSTRPRQVLLP